MEEKENLLINTCSFQGVEPIMMALPYPPTQVMEKNLTYADLLSNDYAGAVSEMSAITQYINNENRLSCEKCPLAKTIVGIAISEMIHLNKLGELIFLLGGDIDFIAIQPNGRGKMWTPQYLTISDNAKDMLTTSIESEKAAINQYRAHMKVINDVHINAILARIIKDEEYHILILQALLNDL